MNQKTQAVVIWSYKSNLDHARHIRDLSRFVKGYIPIDGNYRDMQQEAMETALQKRLKLRMDMMGLNAFQTAKKAGLGDSFVRDILRGKSRNPTLDKLEKLAEALNTTVEWFTGEHPPTEIVHYLQAREAKIDGIAVEGTIQAGAWLDMSIYDSDLDPESKELLPLIRDSRFPYARQYALYVSGDSMDVLYPDKTYVTCVDFADSGVAIRPGLIVHVERYQGALVEITLKAVEIIDGEMALAPKSSNPKHKPIKLEGDEATEIIIRGIVTGSYRRSDI